MSMTSLDQLTEQALALSVPDRIRLAQRLWDSLEDADLPAYTEGELQAELHDRLQDSPDGNWKTHEEVMEQGRREFGCGR